MKWCWSPQSGRMGRVHALCFAMAALMMQQPWRSCVKRLVGGVVRGLLGVQHLSSVGMCVWVCLAQQSSGESWAVVPAPHALRHYQHMLVCTQQGSGKVAGSRPAALPALSFLLAACGWCHNLCAPAAVNLQHSVVSCVVLPLFLCDYVGGVACARHQQSAASTAEQLHGIHPSLADIPSSLQQQ